jgi:hypothetical protein
MVTIKVGTRNVQSVPRQSPDIDRHATLTPSLIPNSNYVIMVRDWKCLKYFWVFFVLWLSGSAETFWSPCVLICSRKWSAAADQKLQQQRLLVKFKSEPCFILLNCNEVQMYGAQLAIQRETGRCYSPYFWRLFGILVIVNAAYICVGSCLLSC